MRQSLQREFTSPNPLQIWRQSSGVYRRTASRTLFGDLFRFGHDAADFHRRSDAPWLDCVLGKTGVIGTGVYQRIAKEEKLELSQPPNAGLIENFASLSGPSFDPDQVDPRIRHFYEHAALYRLEVWSEVYFAGKFVLWLLVEFISR